MRDGCLALRLEVRSREEAIFLFRECRSRGSLPEQGEHGWPITAAFSPTPLNSPLVFRLRPPSPSFTLHLTVQICSARSPQLTLVLASSPQRHILRRGVAPISALRPTCPTQRVPGGEYRLWGGIVFGSISNCKLY